MRVEIEGFRLSVEAERVEGSMVRWYRGTFVTGEGTGKLDKYLRQVPFPNHSTPGLGSCTPLSYHYRPPNTAAYTGKREMVLTSRTPSLTRSIQVIFLAATPRQPSSNPYLRYAFLFSFLFIYFYCFRKGFSLVNGRASK